MHLKYECRPSKKRQIFFSGGPLIKRRGAKKRPSDQVPGFLNFSNEACLQKAKSNARTQNSIIDS